jgi:preprotein translocase subunit SecE
VAAKKKLTIKPRELSETGSKITRIKAIDATPVKKREELVADPLEGGSKKGFVGVLKSIGGYFKGAWVELKQVRWPTRRATWGLTVAVVLFTLFFVGMIIGLDAVFKSLFEIILG